MSPDPEAKLQRIASRQHSVFSRRQALDTGMSRKTIDRYLRCGRWLRLYAGVYVSASVPITWRQQLAAALLACGPEAVASHRGAVAVWGWADGLFVPEVSVPKATRRTHTEIEVHRTRALEATGHDGFRVTKPMRTLVDLASCVVPDRLSRFVDEAHRSGLIHPERMSEYLGLQTNLARPGTGVLREIVASRCGTANDSDLESRFFDALRKCRVPLPVPQHPVMTRGGVRYVDFAFPDRMIAIELDSWTHHGTKTAFERDRPRRNELERLGWHVLQFTWEAVRTDPVGVAVTVAISLGLVPAKWR